ncbi:MAG TPA: chemotaxis protein CheW [Desulfobacterales bacterium]|nr:chemotaxis protein CheW [Desulfobacterales bacterium]
MFEVAATRLAVTPLPGAPEIIRGIVDDRGTIVAVADPRVRLGMPVKRAGLDDRLSFVRTARREIALQVDEVFGTLEIDAASRVPVERVTETAGATRGIVATTDGIILIQDLERFLAGDEEHGLEAAMRSRQAGP